MQIHHLVSRDSKTSRRRGRGGKRGTYSGRGIKGLGARAGGKYRPQERESLKKIPKLRGYRFKRFIEKPAIVNLDTLARFYKTGEIVSPKTLVEKGIIGRRKGYIPAVKVLGRGECASTLSFQNVLFSQKAAKIVHAGISKK